jgi:ATP-dependent Lhr-like helicase
MLAGKYAGSRIRELHPLVSIDRLTKTVRGKEGALKLLYLSGGTIPDRGSYTLRLAGDRSRIGELDEEFVWERKVGDTFTLGTQCWKVVSIDSQSVHVIPWERSINIIPFWKAENQFRAFSFSERILDFLDYWNDKLLTEEGHSSFVSELGERFRMDETSALNLRSFLVRMRESTGCGLPGRHRVVIEAYRDSVRQGEGTALIFHTLWGSGANLPLSLALGEAWAQSYGNEVESFSDNDCVILVLSDPDPEAAERAAGLLRGIAASRSLEALLKKRLESSGFFGALFRENAGRSLLLPKAGYGKRMPLWWTRMRSKKLLDAIMEYPDFPVLIETWRTAFRDFFDMEILSSILSEIDSGETELACCDTAAPSPFSQGVIFQTTGAYIYRGDELEKSRVSNLSNDLIREAVLHSRLRPELDPRIVAEWVKKLKRLISGYAPASREELIDWAKERLIIPFDEWLSLVSLLGEELKDSFASDAFLRKRIILAELRFGGEGNQSRLFILAAENLPRICGSLGLSANQVRLFDLSMRPEGMSGQTDLEETPRELPDEERRFLITEIEGMDEESFDDASLSSLLAELLRFEGPITLGELKSILPVPDDELDAALSSLAAEERLSQDVLVRGSETINLCDADNLDILLRLSRRKARPFVQARPLECLVPFLASYQGLVSSSSPDGLKAVLEKLFGYPLDAGLWEGDIFPSRLHPYYNPLLDGLLSEGRLRGSGAGRGGYPFASKRITSFSGRQGKSTLVQPQAC